MCIGDCIQAFIREVLAVMIKRSLFRSDDQRAGQRAQNRKTTCRILTVLSMRNYREKRQSDADLCPQTRSCFDSSCAEKRMCVLGMDLQTKLNSYAVFQSDLTSELRKKTLLVFKSLRNV